MLMWQHFAFVAVFVVTASAVTFDNNILCPPICPKGFFQYELKCYVIPRITQTWGDALEFCHTFDSGLLRIDSKEEETYLESVLHKHPGKNFWIAATDIIVEGDYRWSDFLGPVVNKWWLKRQPDNRLNRVGHRQHCVVLNDRSYYKWMDEDCLQHYHFICQRPIV